MKCLLGIDPEKTQKCKPSECASCGWEAAEAARRREYVKEHGLTADDGLKNYGGDRVRIGLITCEEYRLLRGNIPALPDRWWWTATPDSPINSFVRYVDSDGTLSYNNACCGSRGVRPLCNLKSEILVSYLNGENAEEQKKRAEAVDMMKHIAAAWDIDAEEVFGRADE